MDEARLEELRSELDVYLSEFDECFRSEPSKAHLSTYVRGQLGTLQRKSIEPMALQGGLAPRTLQQFIGSYRWDEGCMRSRVRRLVAQSYKDPNAIGVIDETSFGKKGRKTTGVQRQWSGESGKIDNCVVTVNLSYVACGLATIVDSDVFVPECWTKDVDRRAEAGVPPDLQFRMKREIAIDLLDRSRLDGLAFSWITADEFYGRATEFLEALEERGYRYIVEIPVSTCGWTPRGLARGRGHRRVDALFARGGPSWINYHVKETTKGPLVWRVRTTPFVLHAGQDRTEKWLLMAANDLTLERKYFLSNAPAETPTGDLLTVAFSRWHIEMNFEESKQEIGLRDFEVRTYTGIQRHIAISMVSLFFLVKTSRALKAEEGENWTLPQTRLVVNTLVDGTLSPSERTRQLAHVLWKIAYWQKRAKVAEKCHRRTKEEALRKAGIDLNTATRCPRWGGS